MKITSLSVPKDRSLAVPSDDTLLILPDLLGVFDGATSPQKARASVSSGRLASQAAASAVAGLSLAEDLLTLPAARIFAAISQRIGAENARRNMDGKPSTTMALAVIGATEIRFVIVGDSGIRANGAQLIHRQKPIDDISTQNRLAIHAVLSRRMDDPDEIERLVRLTLFDGYVAAVAAGVLTTAEADGLCDEMLARFGALGPVDQLRAFLRDGIRQQFRFANREDHPFGFSTLNQDPTALTDIIDLRLPRAGIDSIEIFSDGYFLVPDKVGIPAWEEAFARVEAEDFRKLGRFANVKGSTATEFADDRSIIVAEAVNGLRPA